MQKSSLRSSLFGTLFLASVSGCGIHFQQQGSSVNDNVLFPLMLNRVWTYRVGPAVKDHFALCPIGTKTQSVVLQTKIDGKTVYEMPPLCANEPNAQFAVSNDYVETYSLGHWMPSLDTPLVTGHGWTDGNKQYIWYSAGTVKVAAGTFNDCWRRQQTGVLYNAYSLFCRGAGMVIEHFEDQVGTGWDAELLSKSF